MARIRYIVKDVGEAVAFYTSHLGFKLVQQFGPAIAILQRDDLELLVSGPSHRRRDPCSTVRRLSRAAGVASSLSSKIWRNSSRSFARKASNFATTSRSTRTENRFCARTLRATRSSSFSRAEPSGAHAKRRESDGGALPVVQRLRGGPLIGCAGVGGCAGRGRSPPGGRPGRCLWCCR